MLFFILLYSIDGQGYEKRDLRGDLTQNFTSQTIRFYISSPKSRYSHKEKIPLQLNIHNVGFYPVILYLHKDHLKNFTIVVRDSKGRGLAPRDIFYKKMSEDMGDPFFSNYTGTGYHFRAITVQPNELFKRELDLQEIIEIKKKESGLERFQIQAFFYPNPEQAPNIFIESMNQLTIFIGKEKENKTAEYSLDFSASPLALTPQEVIYLVLSAEYSGNWQNFFKYLSIIDMIKDYPEFAKKYIRSEQSNKVDILNAFRDYLKNRNTHRLLRFQILNSDQNIRFRKKSNEIAVVRAKAARLLEGFEREFIYTYYLTKSDSLWKVTGVESRLIK